METDIENARDRQEIAWNGYVQTSNALRRLLAWREEIVFVPEVEEALAAIRLPMTRVDPLLAEGVGEGLLFWPVIRNWPPCRPGLRQAKPIPVSGTIRHGPMSRFRSAMPWGRRIPSMAMTRRAMPWVHMFNPDQTDLAVFLRYAVPLTNAYEAAATRARATERQTTDQMKETRNRLLRRMDEALKDIRSAEVQMQRSEEELKLANFALQKATDRKERGLMSYYEYLTRSDMVVTARLAAISARIGQQMGIVRYLAARGILEPVMNSESGHEPGNEPGGGQPGTGGA